MTPDALDAGRCHQPLHALCWSTPATGRQQHEATMRAWRVFWRREDRLFFIVGSSGKVFWRTDCFDDAIEIADGLQHARDRRNRDRRAEAEHVAEVRGHRLRSEA